MAIETQFWTKYLGHQKILFERFEGQIHAKVLSPGPSGKYEKIDLIVTEVFVYTMNMTELAEGKQQTLTNLAELSIKVQTEVMTSLKNRGIIINYRKPSQNIIIHAKRFA